MSPAQHLETGHLGEDLATQELNNKGYKILDRNLRLPVGEIDILAKDGKTIVIVEVKTKTSDIYGHPAEMVGKHKQRKLCQLARSLELQYPLRQIRIDVIAVDTSYDPPTLEHLIDVVDCCFDS